MKKVLPILISFVMVVIITGIFISMAKKDQPVTIISGNTEGKALDIELNHTNDVQCAMLIKHMENSAEAVAPDGRTWFFDDPGCMVLWLENRPFKDKAKLWVYAIDTSRWINARSAKYGVTDRTQMHYGFGAREEEQGRYIDFDEMRLRMLRGETLVNPKIRKKLLGI